jgi:hypothetical protein
VRCLERGIQVVECPQCVIQGIGHVSKGAFRTANHALTSENDFAGTLGQTWGFALSGVELRILALNGPLLATFDLSRLRWLGIARAAAAAASGFLARERLIGRALWRQRRDHHRVRVQWANLGRAGR